MAKADTPKFSDDKNKSENFRAIKNAKPKSILDVTTIKLKKTTKERLEKLREYDKETYDEILQRTLGILNLCMASPVRAQARLMIMERHKKMKNSLDKDGKKSPPDFGKDK